MSTGGLRFSFANTCFSYPIQELPFTIWLSFYNPANHQEEKERKKKKELEADSIFAVSSFLQTTKTEDPQI